MVNVLVIEDRYVERLYPVTLSRPAYAVTCACFRLCDWLGRLEANVVSQVRSYLTDVQQFDFPNLTNPLNDSPTTLVISARLVPSYTNFAALNELASNHGENAVKHSVAFDSDGHVIVAVVSTEQVRGKNLAQIQDLLDGLQREAAVKLEQRFDAICLPHDLIKYNQQCFAKNLDLLLSGDRQYKQVRDGLFVAEDAAVSEQIAIDSSEGPVVIDSGSTVGPFSYFCGPVYVGPNCRVNEHSAIKDYVCLTHTVKIGGEVEASVIEPYSNKQHHGFLGHAYLGSWINLGAGTCNSDLKNTYGKVSMTYPRAKVPTGMQFVGCVMGDYSKSAINTSIFTGKLIGVCSNLYGFVSGNVPSFVNYAKSFGEITCQPVEVMQVTQQRMFSRRNVQQRECDIKLLADMYQLTVDERPVDISSKSPTL